MAAAKKIKATAKIQIKYAGEYIKAGEEFEVLEKDVEELSKYAEIDMPKPVKEGE